MSAARKQAFNRNAAIASIQINWAKISPGGDRDERLAWISEYLGSEVKSLKDLSDNQLGAVAGEMKRLTGISSQGRLGTLITHPTHPTQGTPGTPGTVVTPTNGFGGRPQSEDVGVSDVSFAASPQQVYTLKKLVEYLGWSQSDVFEFIRKRVIRGKDRFSGSVPNLQMLRFKQATTATHILLQVAAHRDLKKRDPNSPVKRDAIEKYIPLLKEQLRIDRHR